MNLLSFVKKSHSSNYCLSLICDSQSESSDSVNFIEKFRPGSWFRIRCLELSPIYLDTNFLPHLKKKRKSIKIFLSNCYDSILLSCDKVTPKWCAKVKPKWVQSDAKVKPKWVQSDAKVTPKWCQSDAKVTTKWSQSEAKLTKDLLIKWFLRTFWH